MQIISFAVLENTFKDYLCVMCCIQILFVAGDMIFYLMYNFINVLLNIISENTHRKTLGRD